MDFQKRIDAARALMAERGVDVLLVSHPANREYLSGFANADESSSAAAAWIILTPTAGYFVTSFLYYEAIAGTLRHLEPTKSESRPLPAVIDMLKKLPPARIGFESSWMSHGVVEKLSEGIGAGHTLTSADGLIERLREIKDADELAVMRRAIALTDRVYQDVVARIQPGQTEKEVAWALESAMRVGGAEGMAFGPDVAAGPNAAVPHHRPTDYRLRVGEPIWIDMGARVDGYCADLTRSFCLVTATPEYQATYDLVLRAQQKALAGLKAGLSTKDADAIARQTFEDAGRGSEFGHSLGHGVGLNIHEAPLLARTSEETLRTGMVVTVEPGLYRAGWGGVRIEDVVLVKSDGVEILSAAPKQPIVAPAT